MDLYNLVTKIPYLIMLGVGLTLIINLYMSGLQDLEVDVDDASEQDYRKALVLENLLNVDASDSEADFEYNKRRAVMPAEFLKNEDPDDDEIGYKVENGHCYIEEVTGLDGTNFGFGVDDHTELDIDCDNHIALDSAKSPVLVLREDEPPTEVFIHVYPVL